MIADTMNPVLAGAMYSAFTLSVSILGLGLVYMTAWIVELIVK